MNATLTSSYITPKKQIETTLKLLSDLQSYLKAQIDEEIFFGEDKIIEIKNLENVFADD